METKELFEQIVSGEKLNFQQKLGVIKDLVSPKVYETISKQVVLASATGERVEFKISTDGCKMPDEDISRLLKIIGAKDFKVSSKQLSSNDMMGYSENYVNTMVSFNM